MDTKFERSRNRELSKPASVRRLWWGERQSGRSFEVEADAREPMKVGLLNGTDGSSSRPTENAPRP